MQASEVAPQNQSSHEGKRGLAFVLDFADNETTIIVRPNDQELFLTTAAKAAALFGRTKEKAADEVDRSSAAAKNIAEGLLKIGTRLHVWCDQRRDRIEECYLTIRDSDFAVFVIVRAEDYDVALDDDIDELRDELEDKFEDCPTDVAQITRGSKRVFIDFDRAIQVYGTTTEGRGAGAPPEGAMAR